MTTEGKDPAPMTLELSQEVHRLAQESGMPEEFIEKIIRAAEQDAPLAASAGPEGAAQEGL